MKFLTLESNPIVRVLLRWVVHVMLSNMKLQSNQPGEHGMTGFCTYQSPPGPSPAIERMISVRAKTPKKNHLLESAQWLSSAGVVEPRDSIACWGNDSGFLVFWHFLKKFFSWLNHPKLPLSRLGWGTQNNDVVCDPTLLYTSEKNDSFGIWVSGLERKKQKQ